MQGSSDDEDYDEDIDDVPIAQNESTFEKKKTSIFAVARVATVTCLHQYAIERIQGAEKRTLPWPVLMLEVIDYLNNRYQRVKLVSERNLAMLELLLDVPIQLKLINGDTELKLSDPGVLDFSGYSFHEALEILRDLLREGIVKRENLRVPYEMVILK
jgi:hypothetical protein